MLARRPSLLISLTIAVTVAAACSRIEPGSGAIDSGAPASSAPASSTTTETTEPMVAASSTTVVQAPTSTTAEVATTAVTAPGDVQVLKPEIVDTFPHDPKSFTQGLEFHGASLIESLGEYGSSARRIIDPTTGVVTTEVALPLEQFGNGLTVSNGRLIQLTWRAGRAIVADPDTLEATAQFDFEGEGWGICADTDRLIMSNGSSRLSFRDPETFEVTGSVNVTFDGQPVSNINELECVEGVVWANRWLTSEILGIDPATGAVTAIVDARSLIPADQTLGQEDVLNGIAYRDDTDTFFVTGKRWNTLYEVRFVPTS